MADKFSHNWTVCGIEIQFKQGYIIVNPAHDLLDPAILKAYDLAKKIAPLEWLLTLHNGVMNFPKEDIEKLVAPHSLDDALGIIITISYVLRQEYAILRDIPEKTKRPGYVYVVKSNEGLYKIGRTNDPYDRIETFRLKLPFHVEYMFVIETDDMFATELYWHHEFAHKRIAGEWFDLDNYDLVRLGQYDIRTKAILNFSPDNDPYERHMESRYE